MNGLEESDLADDVCRAARRAGIEVITDPEPERNAFVRSDQFSFLRRGIPALSLKGGFTLGTPEHERILRCRQERYHGVEDEVDPRSGQPGHPPCVVSRQRLPAGEHRVPLITNCDISSRCCYSMGSTTARGKDVITKWWSSGSCCRRAWLN